jgi:hypothetical protein
MRSYIIADKPQLKQILIKKWESDNYKNSAILAKEFNLSRTSVYSFLKRSGCRMKTIAEAKRIYTIDEHFFDIIDTEEKAYFLGFLYADGYNCERIGTVILSLQERDKSILLKLKDIIGYGNSLKFVERGGRNQNIYTLRIANKHISNKLAELGCPQAKTKKIIYPQWMPINLHRHFIRGVFDGDGCVSGAAFGLCGTEAFLTRTQEIMIKEMGLSKTKLIIRNMIKGKECYYVSLHYTGYTNLGLIYQWFYKDSSIYLERKKKKFEDYILPHNNKNRKWDKIGNFVKI